METLYVQERNGSYRAAAPIEISAAANAARPELTPKQDPTAEENIAKRITTPIPLIELEWDGSKTYTVHGAVPSMLELAQLCEFVVQKRGALFLVSGRQKIALAQVQQERGNLFTALHHLRLPLYAGNYAAPRVGASFARYLFGLGFAYTTLGFQSYALQRCPLLEPDVQAAMVRGFTEEATRSGALDGLSAKSSVLAETRAMGDLLVADFAKHLAAMAEARSHDDGEVVRDIHRLFDRLDRTGWAIAEFCGVARSFKDVCQHTLFDEIVSRLEAKEPDDILDGEFDWDNDDEPG